MIRRPPRSTLFPTRRSSDLIRSKNVAAGVHPQGVSRRGARVINRREVALSAQHKAMVRAASCQCGGIIPDDIAAGTDPATLGRSEEHTSELQSQSTLACRAL